MKTNSKFVANLFKSCGLLVPFVVVSCGENPEKVLTLPHENEEQKEEGNVETTKTTEQQPIAENDEVQEKKEEEQQPIVETNEVKEEEQKEEVVE